MAASNRRDLYLQVSGNVDKLDTAMKAGKSALLSLGNAAIDVQAEVDRAFADLGANAPAQAKVLERSYVNTFNAIRQNARAIVDAPNAGAALQVLDVGAAQQAAAAAENQAVALRQVATAAAAVALKVGEAGEAERVLAVAAAATAQQAENEAVALRNQANVLGSVRGELETMGVAHRNVVTRSEQQRQSTIQLGQQLQDFSVQVVSGQSVITAFSQQIGQAAFAVQGMGGKLAGVANFLTSGWGIAATVGLVVLAPLVAKVLEHSDALGEETDRLKDNAEKSAIADQAKKAFLSTEAGAIDDVRALTEEIKKQNDALRTNAELTNIRAKKDLAQLQKDRASLAKQLADAEKTAGATPLTGGVAGTGSYIQAGAQRQAANLRARLGQVDKSIVQAQADRLESQRDLAGEAAKRRADPLEQIRHKYESADGLIEVEKKNATAAEVTNGTLLRRLDILKAAQKAESEAAQKKIAASKKTTNENQIGRTVDIAEATRIVAGIGGRVTSGYRSTEKQAQIYADKLAGRHAGPVAKPGTSDHERGQAIDIAYGPGISASSIKAAFAKEGVAIRQLLNERDQKVFHVAFGSKGKSQESIDRSAEVAAQKRIRDDEAYAQLKNRADQELLDIKRAQVVGTAAAAQLDEQAVRLEQARLDSAVQAGVAEKRWSQAKADEVKALNRSVADLKVAAIDERKRTELAAQALQIQRDDLQGQNALLSLQADLASTAADRRRIGLEILANEERIARASLQTAIDAEKDPDKKADLQRQLGRVGPEFTGRRTQLERQTDDPLQSYGRRLSDATENMDEAFKGVKADGLQQLEDGLVGLISGTESVAGAFKKMASAIIADLARIAIEKAIVGVLGKSFFGFATGGLVTPEGHATGGFITGPGSGTSDDILSWLSNGEFVVTAAATRRHLPLLKAINDNQLPGFATGGIVGSLPSLPNVRTAANDVYASQRDRLQVDLHAKIEAADDFDVKMQSVAYRAVGSTAEPIMAGAEARTVRRLNRAGLPGGLG